MTEPIDYIDSLADIESTHQILSERYHSLLIEINHLIETNKSNSEHIERFRQLLKEKKNEENAINNSAFDDD